MQIPKKISNFLEKVKTKYEVVGHRTVYTAFDKAATLKVSEKMIGKTLVTRIDKRVALVMIPANKNLDILKLGKTAKTKKISFIKEAWIKKNLKGVKIGAIPPFGNLWRVPTFVDKSLINLPKIILNSGDYNFSIKLKGAALRKMIPDLIIGNFTKVRK
ncbi:MAG TPA: YbaK/EbsC family protein [Candidatus Humimicrobiaceae bacterium]|nr:YbaK/EbsC family protein [Candidatus Humimicrobiaceae bacterium]